MKNSLPLVLGCCALMGAHAPMSQAAENGLGARPYLGWSSWSLEATKYPGYDGQNWLTAANIKTQSDALQQKLQAFGYEYINVDAGWRGGWDEWGRPVPDAKKFPLGMRELSDYVHAKKQKFGIYYVPGIDDDLLEKNPPIKGTNYRIRDIIFVPRRIANGWGGGHAIDFSKPGSNEYIQSIADLFAQWQIDFLKFDGVTPGSDRNDVNTDVRADVAAWGRALLRTKRPIWFTVSWKIDMRFNDEWRRYANAIRTGGDVESYDEKLTHWPQITWRFDDARLYGWTAGNGKGWNDLDSLIVGNGEMSGLTPDERRSTMTLWAISASPLYVGDDLTKLDALGLELLTNREVLAIQQSGKVAAPLNGKGHPNQVWFSKNDDGSFTVALFNLFDRESKTLEVNWNELGIKGASQIRDVWTQQNLGVFNRQWRATVPPHGCRLLKITPTANR